MRDLWVELRERYDDDSYFRMQIQCAVCVGLIGVLFAVLETKATTITKAVEK
jgi:hypothetical protein